MTTARNDITGDQLRTKPSSDKYRENWERIFGNSEKIKPEKAQNNKK